MTELVALPGATDVIKHIESNTVLQLVTFTLGSGEYAVDI